MGLLPDKKIERVVFYEQRFTPWAANAAAIGLTPAEAGNIGTLSGAARTAYNQQQAAQIAAKNATVAFNEALRRLELAGADAIRKIRARAEAPPGSPTVYTLALIPPPAVPSPVAAPGTPTDFEVKLIAGGAVELSWKCVNPRGAVGTVYEVARRPLAGAGAEGPYTFVGVSGTRSFVDDTLPTGGGDGGGVTYRVTALRSTRRGLPAEFNVRLGGPGGVTVTRVERPPTSARLAA